MRSSRMKRKVISEINITPFVDVILVLLVIFMVTAPMLSTGIDVKLPKTQATKSQTHQDPVVVSIDKSGLVFLQKQGVDLEELGVKISYLKSLDNNIQIFIRADKDIDYGRVMYIMGIINASGVTNISLVTEPLGTN